MLNKVAKLALVSTSLAPICLTLWFVEFSKDWDWQQGWGYLVTALLLSLICFGLIRLSARKLESLPVKIKSIRTADKEIVGFLLVYLLPLIKQSTNSISMPVLVFVAIFFFLIMGLASRRGPSRWRSTAAASGTRRGCPIPTKIQCQHLKKILRHCASDPAVP